jgi:hypothetical protein
MISVQYPRQSINETFQDKEAPLIGLVTTLRFRFGTFLQALQESSLEFRFQWRDHKRLER